jgi:hypothetical protein
MGDSTDLDDSYSAVLEQNASHIRTVGITHLRAVPDDAAVVVDLPEASATLAEVAEGFGEVESGRSALDALAADPSRRVFLVLRPDEDLTRPGRYGVDVEWIDNGRRRSAHIPG